MSPALARPVLLAVLLLAPPGRADAQWILSAGVRAPRYHGGAEEPRTGRTLAPYRPTMWEVGVEPPVSRIGVGVRFRYAASSLALEGTEAVAVVKDALSVYGIDPELSLRIGTLAHGSVVRAYAGPVVDIWTLPDVGSRVRVGGSVGLGLEVLLGGRWSMLGRVGGSVTASPFDRRDLLAGFERRSLWRREVGAVLGYRL